MGSYHLANPNHFFFLLVFPLCATSLPHVAPMADNCPSSEWSTMCRPCCEYHLIQCRCPSKGSKVGYTVPCCRNALDQCDPCIIHPGCSLFENCKTCHNGTWKANDDFFVNGKYCTECRQGWSGGDCKICGGIIRRTQGHIALESYPTNARCEWRVQVERGNIIELRFSLLNLEFDHRCHYDYIELRDGRDLNSPVIGRFCGDKLPPPLQSSGNSIHILFTSDGYNNFDGFVLTFQERPAKNPTCAPPDTLANGYMLPVFDLEEKLVSVNYRCLPHFTLIGPQERTCLFNGTWSGKTPTCVKVQCSLPPKPLNGFYRTTSHSDGGAEMVEFFCKNSYILAGNRYSTCISNGTWSSRPPKCVRACRVPKVSDLVQQHVIKPHHLLRENPGTRLPVSSTYDIHDILSGGFFPLTTDRKLDTVDASLEELPRGFHSVFTRITYKCSSPLYHNTGSSQRTCLKTGRWSGRHASCSPVCGKLDTSSTLNLTYTQLPWHAAIYIRSPPVHTDSSPRPPVMTLFDQQGASEEATFWYLACSGALIAQRSVLLAAHCVVKKDTQELIPPANVRVVVGRQKKKHHLRISNILVHPSFFTAPDFNVAVLKLKDKAKISQRVLPVCLPELQGGEVTTREAYTSRWMISNDHKQMDDYIPLSTLENVELSDVSHCERQFAKQGAHTPSINDNSLCIISKMSSPQGLCSSFIPGITTVLAVQPATGGVSSGHEETLPASTAGWQLLGLESFVYKETNCPQKTHSVQVKIANFQNWIKDNMK